MKIYKYFLCLAAVLSLDSLGMAKAVLPSRLSAKAYPSTGYTIGEVDLMWPMAGDPQHNFYLDPSLAYGTDNQGYADLGLGYRFIKKEATIFGVFLFGGYTRIDNNARLWVANPGIEVLGTRWDAHLNVYLPMGDRHTTVSYPKKIFFTGHSLFSELNKLSQYAGAGGDMSVGGQLSAQIPLKVYVGSYFFNPAQTHNVWGGAAGLDYWLDNNIKVFVSYTYDNLRHSTSACGIGMELGGTHRSRMNPTLEERMTDPVGRYLADLGRGSSIPTRLKDQPNTLVSLYQNNIAFFSQTGQPNNGGLDLNRENCTFENPCGPLDFTNQATATLNSLLASTLFAFEEGVFAATDVPGGVNPVTMRTGQSITSIGLIPSTLVGGLILEGDNSVSRMGLQPTMNTITGAGITVLSRSNQIVNAQIGSPVTPFATGLQTLDSSATRISESNIFASSLGIQNESSGSIVLSASNLEVDAGTKPGIGMNGMGVSVTSIEKNSVVTVLGGDHSVGIRSASSGPLPTLVDRSVVNVTGGTNTIGIEYLGSSGLSVQNGALNVTGAANSSGIQIASSSSGEVSVVKSLVTVDLGSAGGGTGINILAGSASRVTVEGCVVDILGGDNTVGLNNLSNNSTSLTNGSGVRVIGGTASRGIVSLASSAMTIQDSAVDITGGTNTIGIEYLGGGGLNLQNGSIDVTGAANSSGIQIASISSGEVSVVNSPVTVDLGSAGGGTGINILAGSASRVTVEGCVVDILGGDNTVGLNNLSNNSTSLTNGSVVRVIGGTASRGIVSLASSAMTIQDSAVDITGGTNTIGIEYLGGGGLNLQNGALNVTGATNSSGIQIASSSSGMVSVVNSAVDITGGTRTMGIEYLGSGGLSVQNGALNVMGAANSSGIQIASISSGVVSVVNNPVTVDLSSAGGGTGINILAGSASSMTVESCAIKVLGGDNTVGLNNNSGTGHISLSNGSGVSVTGGSNSTGIRDSSATLMTIDHSAINTTGGPGTNGIEYVGVGSMDLKGVTLNVVGGDNSTGFNYSTGTGAINIMSSTLTVNAENSFGVVGVDLFPSDDSKVNINESDVQVSGGEVTSGIILRGEVIFIGDKNAMSVNGKTGFTYGLKAFNDSRGDNTNGKIVVLQSGDGIPIGIAVQDTSIVTNTTVDIYVGANHNTQAIGAQALTTTIPFIEFDALCNVTVFGDSSSIIASGNVLFGGTSVCTLNGAYVPC